MSIHPYKARRTEMYQQRWSASFIVLLLAFAALILVLDLTGGGSSSGHYTPPYPLPPTHSYNPMNDPRFFTHSPSPSP